MTEISDEQIAEILRRKTAFFAERKRAIGTEYYENRDFWERMWETEWEMLSDRLEKTDEEIQIEPLPVEFPTLKVEGEQLTLYSFDDFALLHNQGIFRETRFVIDRRGRWTKNVVKEMETYGYEHEKTVGRDKLLVMKWKTN
jgi:hypothetical protein